MFRKRGKFDGSRAAIRLAAADTRRNRLHSDAGTLELIGGQVDIGRLYKALDRPAERIEALEIKAALGLPHPEKLGARLNTRCRRGRRAYRSGGRARKLRRPAGLERIFDLTHNYKY